MRVQFINTIKIPQPGACWRHYNSKEIYMAIHLEENKRKILFPEIKYEFEKYIVSISLSTGFLYYTDIEEMLPMIIVEPNNEEKTMFFVDKWKEIKTWNLILTMS